MYWVTGLLGVVLMVAPFMFGYSDNAMAVGTSLIVGLATLVVSFIEAAQADKEPWEYWTAVVLGLGAIAAPFVFGFNTQAVAMWTTIAGGILITLFAGSRLTTGQWGKT